MTDGLITAQNSWSDLQRLMANANGDRNRQQKPEKFPRVAGLLTVHKILNAIFPSYFSGINVC